LKDLYDFEKSEIENLKFDNIIEKIQVFLLKRKNEEKN